MELPAIVQGDPLTRLVQGAVAGFLATAIISFNWGGEGRLGDIFRRGLARTWRRASCANLLTALK